MQPYFFPYVGYWQLINAVDKYIIYDDVNFIKRTWINRNRILMNGEGKLITLQLHNASQNKLINEVEVLGNPISNKKLLKTLENCYKKAPYFSDAFLDIKSVITQEEKNLAKYLEFAIKKVCEYLSIDTELIVSSDIRKNNELRGQNKIIDICKALCADEYINAIGGQKLYSYSDFSTKGIGLKFLRTGDIKYTQFKSEFVPSLSIIDVIMFNEPRKINKMLDDYVLL